jgi:3-hexulose-6-phosphate synthase
MTKLQIALDGDYLSTLAILSQVDAFIDIAEIGTPLIYREGMRAVRHIRETYPDLMLLADLKIMDAGEEEAQIAFEAGADIVTVLGVTNNSTIRGAVKSAQKHQGQLMVDMMQVDNPIERSRQLLEMGCDILCVHTAYDLQSSQESPYLELQKLREHLPTFKLAIAGGVNLSKLDDILPYSPDIIVVGGAITGADNPADTARQLYERIKSYDN